MQQSCNLSKGWEISGLHRVRFADSICWSTVGHSTQHMLMHAVAVGPMSFGKVSLKTSQWNDVLAPAHH